MRRVELMGYCDRLSVKPGETVHFMATARSAGTAEAQLVRLLHGATATRGW